MTPKSRLWVSAVALVGDDGRVLMQQRPQGSAHAGLWEFPGGKVEPGETARQAAVREIFEELGLTLDPGDLVETGFAGGDAITLLLFSCRAWSGQVRSSFAARIAWVAADRIIELAMPPLDYPLARQLGAALEHNLV